MDKSLFISMNGAKTSMHQLEVVTNNLANVNTTGYRSDSTFMEQYNVNNKGHQTRVYAKLSKTYTDFTPGPTINTGRDLDLALNGDGFISVQSKSGKEGYTRAGSLSLTSDGTLVTQTGHLVLGNSGSISIPPSTKVHISNDGTVSAKLLGAPDLIPIDKIKLVKPDVTQLQKGVEGLFFLNGDGTAAQDSSVKLTPGAIEGSNVSAIQTMTQLIDLTRHYEIHTNFMKTTGDDSSKANQILALR